MPNRGKVANGLRRVCSRKKGDLVTDMSTDYNKLVSSLNVKAESELVSWTETLSKGELNVK